MMEEQRRGWHPEKVPDKGSDDTILVVGGGPAGLECANILARRGYQVTLAETRDELGGRVLRESRLPGLNEWLRVADYRTHALRQMSNVSLYTGSTLRSDDILGFAARHVVLATGAVWRRDGVGRFNADPMAGADRPNVFTPDDIMDGVRLRGPVVIYDEDGSYMGNIIAEKLHAEGQDVVVVTPSSEVAPYLALTMEQHKVAARLVALEIRVERLKRLEAIDGETVRFACVHGGKGMTLRAASIVMLTSRIPNDGVYRDLKDRHREWPGAGIESVSRIGDCEAPNIIAAAVHSGHRWARELDGPGDHHVAHLPERAR
jgi:dimethylamine/trimethylamine dehydrogenase